MFMFLKGPVRPSTVLHQHGRVLLVGVMSVLSVMLLPDCLCCTAAISRNPRHVFIDPLRLLPIITDLLWGISYPFPGESAVGVISAVPAHDFSATGGCSWGTS